MCLEVLESTRQCMVGFGHCLEVIWRVSGRVLEGIWKVQEMELFFIERDPKFFGTKNFLAPKIILDPKLFSGPIIFLLQSFFSSTIILDPDFFGPNFFLTQNFLGSKFFGQKFCWTQKFLFSSYNQDIFSQFLTTSWGRHALWLGF